MSRKKLTRRQLKKAQAKTVGKSPVWLKTVQIAKPFRHPRVKGTFGAASEVVSIDPATGLPRDTEALA